MEEVVRDGETGFLVRSWSAGEMADKIHCLLEDRGLYKRCASSAAQIALQFEYEQTIERYAMTYRELGAT
jgi:glycosyltransferase involved in cell wall biosynthesis